MSSECGKLGRMEYLRTLAWANNIYIMVNIITYIQNGIFWNIWGHLLESIFPSLALPTAGCLQYTTIQNTFTSFFWTCQKYFNYWKVKISRISKMSLYFPHSYFTQQEVAFNTKLLWGKCYSLDILTVSEYSKAHSFFWNCIGYLVYVPYDCQLAWYCG